jgi:RNA polymerase sigma factor (sigma-70 family)
MLESSTGFRRDSPDTRTLMGVQAPRRADDRTLAERTASGDTAAFEAIFERHHRGLLSLCRHLLGSREEAEDVLQHTFAVAYRELVERGAPDHLRAWLYATARNRCLDLLRQRRELPAGLPAGATAGLPEEVERRSDLRELLDDLGRLPEDQRAALVLSELGDMEHAEVAEVLGCRRDKVRALVYQARAALAGWREARAMSCRSVREEIAIARGSGLRRGHLRRHLKLCADCAAFREDVDRQRRRVAALLPVVPALGLKARVLEAAVGGGGAAAGGGAVAGGGLAAGTLGAPAAKLGAAALVLGVAGVATFGGLPGGGGSQGDGSPDRVPPTAPASAPQQPASGGEARPADRRPEPVRRAAEKRLRVREQRQTSSAAETVDPNTSVQPAPAPPAPAPPAPAPPEGQPEPDQPPQPEAEPPAPEQPAPTAPAPGSQRAEDRSAPPQADVEVEVEVGVEPPDSLP